MKHIKMLGLLAVAAAALTAFAGTASATSLTSPPGTLMAIGSTIEGTSTNGELHGSFITISCSHSHFKGTLTENGTKNGNSATISISTTGFSGCNYTVTVKKAGSLSISKTGTTTSTGAEIALHTSVGECVGTTSSTDVGAITGGTGAKIDINASSIPRTGGSFFCGSSFEWTGDYTITSPSSVSVH